jgi:redox-sensing transcriptional repressor
LKKNSIILLKSTLGRLPLYYCYLEEMMKNGEEYVSSAVLAQSLSINPVQVRKDLASVSSVPGRPKLGFKTNQLYNDIKSHLGYDNYDEAVLVGVGSLGKVLMKYNGFTNYGLEIIAGFDANPTSKQVGGKAVMSIDMIESFLQRFNIKIGIIAVPSSEAQKVADLLVSNGVQAIWNFAPATLRLPDNVLIKNENLAASLAALTTELRRRN